MMQKSVEKTGRSAEWTFLKASRCVAGLPQTGRIFPKKRQFWQLLASDQLIKTKLLNKKQNEMKVKIYTFFIK